MVDRGEWAGDFLLDGDGRREAVNVFDLRLGHLSQELAGVGRERFDVAPLAFRVERVHGEGRFTAAAGPAENADLLAWHVDVDVLQIVLSRSADHDFVCGRTVVAVSAAQLVRKLPRPAGTARAVMPAVFFALRPFRFSFPLPERVCAAGTSAPPLA